MQVGAFICQRNGSRIDIFKKNAVRKLRSSNLEALGLQCKYTYKSFWPNISQPHQTFHNFQALKSGDRRLYVVQKRWSPDC